MDPVMCLKGSWVSCVGEAMDRYKWILQANIVLLAKDTALFEEA